VKTSACAWITLIVFVAAGVNGAEAPRGPEVVDCHHATLSKPGVGNEYKGSVDNDDYAFSVRIPPGLTGWDGVARDAPFHGFTIFLDSKLSACIVFEIHVRVDENDKPAPPASAVPMRLGAASAWQSTRQSPLTSGPITNVRALLSFKRPDQVDDGEILLVAPTSALAEARPIYDAFVRSLVFHRKTRSGSVSAPPSATTVGVRP
jgi:hypothetical protein